MFSFKVIFFSYKYLVVLALLISNIIFLHHDSKFLENQLDYVWILCLYTKYLTIEIR